MHACRVEGAVLGAEGGIMSKPISCFQGAITTPKLEAVQWIALGVRESQDKLWH